MRQNAIRLALGAAVLLSGLVTAQAAQKTVTTKDANGSASPGLSFCAFDAGSFGIAPCHVPVSSSGVELFTANNPGSVTLAFGGSTFALGQKPSAAGIGVTLSAEQESILSQVLARLPAVGSAQGVDTVRQGTARDCGLVIPVAATGAAVNAGGSGFAVNDTVTNAAGTFKVTAVSSGAITAVTVVTASSLTTVPTAPLAQTSTSGSGTGATLTPAYASQATTMAVANTSRRGLEYQPYGFDIRASGLGSATQDFHSRYIPSRALYETPNHHVGTGALSVIGDIGVTVPVPVYCREF